MDQEKLLFLKEISLNEINISYKTKDKKYLIVALETYEFMDIKICLEKLPKEFDSLKDLFGNFSFKCLCKSWRSDIPLL